MAYHGYIPLIHQVAGTFEKPKILEIGVWTGVTTFSLASRLSRSHESFSYTGVDILIRDDVKETLKYMGVNNDNIRLYEQNSLKFLEDCSEVFDIVLIDGDHNYYTVKNELRHLEKITHKDSLVVIDDYHGKWSKRDLFYSERDEYLNVGEATKRVDCDKKGVRPAVDEFLLEKKHWSGFSPIQGEPIVLCQKESRFLV